MKKAAQVIGLILLVSCGTGERKIEKPRSNWYALPNAHARCFRILTNGELRQLVVFGPGGGTDTLAVYRMATAREGAHNGAGRAGEIPLLRKVAVVSTTHLAYISVLGNAEAVVGAAHLERIRDPAVLAGVAGGTVHEIATGDGLDKEMLLSLAPDALLDYPFGRSGTAQENGPVRVEVTEYLEEHPLGRAEWIRFFGVLFGEEFKSDSIYKAIELRYNTVSDLARILPDHPKVFFGSAWQGQWHVPPGNSYMARLIDDAGGQYVYAEQEADGNIPLDLETVMVQAREVRHFGAVLSAPGRVKAADLAGGDTRVASLDAVRRGGFYLDSQGSDVFGMALLEPDQLLLDLRCIFHPQHCGGHLARYAFALDQ